MAPEGFAVMVPSPGISPLGLVASTAFNVAYKSNHLLSLWTVEPGPQRKHRGENNTDTYGCNGIQDDTLSYDHDLNNSRSPSAYAASGE